MSCTFYLKFFKLISEIREWQINLCFIIPNTDKFCEFLPQFQKSNYRPILMTPAVYCHWDTEPKFVLTNLFTSRGHTSN